MSDIGRTRFLAANMTWAFASAVYSLVVALVVYHVLISTMSTAALGTWSIAVAAMALGRISDFALSASHIREVAALARHSGSSPSLGQVARSGGIAALCALVLVSVSGPLTLWISADLLRREISESQFVVLLAITGFAGILGSFSTVVASTFDGLQVAKTRAQLTMVGVTANCIFVYLFIARIGILSLPVGQLIQYTAVATISTVILVLKYKIRLGSCGLKTNRRERFRFMGMLQGVAVCQQAFQYVAKYMFLRFGGAEVVGLLEISLRSVLAIRQIITGALSVLLPFSAFETVDETGASTRACVVGTIVTVVVSLICCLFVLAVGAPALQWLAAKSIGDLQWILSWVALGWIGSLWSAPLFYTIMGRGNARAPLFAAVVMIAALIAGSVPIGRIWGWHLVAVAYAGAIWLGTVVVTASVRDRDFMSEYLPRIRSLAGTVLIIFIIGAVIEFEVPVSEYLIRLVVAIASAFSIAGLAIIMHRRDLSSAFSVLLRRRKIA